MLGLETEKGNERIFSGFGNPILNPGQAGSLLVSVRGFGGHYSFHNGTTNRTNSHEID